MTQIEMDARAASSTGLDPSFAGALAYLAGPFSGIIVLLAEQTNQYVRFHAWQAIIALGGLGLFAVALLLCAFLGLFVSPVLFKTLYVSSAIAAFVWLVVWAVCLVKAYGGSVWKLPLVGNLAERVASRPRAK